jgi:hypothetical protein
MKLTYRIEGQLLFYKKPVPDDNPEKIRVILEGWVDIFP